MSDHDSPADQREFCESTLANLCDFPVEVTNRGLDSRGRYRYTWAANGSVDFSQAIRLVREAAAILGHKIDFDTRYHESTDHTCCYVTIGRGRRGRE